MKEITKSNYQELIKNSNNLVIKFEADWCKPCQAISPIFEKLEIENPSVDFLVCNVDENPEIANKYNVRNIPLILFFKNGELIQSHVGANSQPTFQQKINTCYNI